MMIEKNGIRNVDAENIGYMDTNARANFGYQDLSFFKVLINPLDESISFLLFLSPHKKEKEKNSKYPFANTIS